MTTNQQRQQQPEAPGGGFVTLGAPDLPPPGYRFLALVLSPSFEVGILAVRDSQDGAEPQEEGEHYQYMTADAALFVVDTLLNRLWDIIPQATPEFVQREAERLIRLRNAWQAAEKTRARQTAQARNQQQATPQGQPGPQQKQKPEQPDPDDGGDGPGPQRPAPAAALRKEHHAA
jgi:hypothetical protein